MLWFALTLILGVGVAFTCWPMLRRKPLAGGAATPIYISQLAEIEREQTAGLISIEDGRLARTEIERRILSTATATLSTQETALTLTDRTTFIAIAAAVAISSAIIYAVVGSPETPSPSSGRLVQSELRQEGEASDGAQMNVAPVSEMIGKLEDRLKSEPQDAEGWRMLGWSKFRTDDYAGAAAAYARAVKLTPQDAETQSAYGEALARAAGGRVTPDATAALDAALRIDPKDARARFLLGLKKEQEGHAQQALDDWLNMLSGADPDAPWFDEVRGRAIELSQASGIDIASRLPPARATGAAGESPKAGPTPLDVAQASTMSADDRQAMIDGMVSRLDTRLKDNPKDLEGWIRLIRARRVLGQEDLASRALADGQAAFAGNNAAIADLRRAFTESLSLPPT